MSSLLVVTNGPESRFDGKAELSQCKVEFTAAKPSRPPLTPETPPPDATPQTPDPARPSARTRQPNRPPPQPHQPPRSRTPPPHPPGHQNPKPTTLPLQAHRLTIQRLVMHTAQRQTIRQPRPGHRGNATGCARPPVRAGGRRSGCRTRTPRSVRRTPQAHACGTGHPAACTPGASCLFGAWVRRVRGTVAPPRVARRPGCPDGSMAESVRTRIRRAARDTSSGWRPSRSWTSCRNPPVIPRPFASLTRRSAPRPVDSCDSSGISHRRSSFRNLPNG